MRLFLAHLYFFVLMSSVAIRSQAAETADIVQEKLIILSNYRISPEDFHETLINPAQKPALDELNISSYEQYERWCDINKSQWEEIRKQAFLSPEEFQHALNVNRAFKILAENGAVVPDYNWYIFKFHFSKANGCAYHPLEYYQQRGTYNGYTDYINEILLPVIYKPIPECVDRHGNWF